MRKGESDVSEETPERLKQFRAQYKAQKSLSSNMGCLIVLLIVGFASVWGFLGDIKKTVSSKDAVSAGGLAPEQLREYAAYLAERQQPVAAIEAYQAYLDRATLEPEARANVCYSVAKLAIEAQRFEDALPYLYQAEFLAPESALKDEIDKKVVLCLDKLGRPVDLRKELRQRTRIQRTAADVAPGEVVLAEFAGEVITDRDLDVEIEKLPPYVRDSISGAEKRAEFLKNLVAQRLLVDKARRLELDQAPEVQEQLARQLDAMIVQQLISNEVQSRIAVTDEDVERFYKASPERFTEPATAEVRVARAASAEALEALQDFPEKTVTVRKGAAIAGVPELEGAAEALLAAAPGDRVGPYQAEQGWYAFQVVSKTPERLKPFAEVAEQARRMYETQKQQEELSALIERTLQERDVKLHLDRLQKRPSAP